MRHAQNRHQTKTDNRPWNGQRASDRLKAHRGRETRDAYAWASNELGGRFLHHEIGDQGSVGAANLRACQAALAMLNGARGGSSIPAADRRAVYDHLAGHLRDGGLEVPELHVVDTTRTADYGAELRVEGEGDDVRLVGYTVEWNALSHELYPGLRERFLKGAFTKTLREQDVTAIWQHDNHMTLGRLSNKTLELSEDSRGLAHVIHPPKTQTVRDLVIEPIRRGDVLGMSFSFRAVRESFDREPEFDVRTVSEAALFHVSPVNEPAYPQSSVQARSQAAAWLEAQGFDPAALDARDTDAIIEPEPRVVPRSVRERQLEVLSRS